jgi:cytochrome c oxidase cbb3-type subunit 3
MRKFAFRFPPIIALDCAKAAALVASFCLVACGGGGADSAVTEQQLAELRTRSDAFVGKDVAALAADASAMALGKELFAAHCASCHGGAEGTKLARDTPDLALAVFDYGDSVEAIRTTITMGRYSVMPKHGNETGEAELGWLVGLVTSMSTGEPMGVGENAARTLYEARCIECHGAEGKGDPARGIPDLTDGYWQHGNSMMNIRMVITRGTESQCPAQQDVLSAAEIELLTAYVVKLRKG